MVVRDEWPRQSKRPRLSQLIERAAIQLPVADRFNSHHDNQNHANKHHSMNFNGNSNSNSSDNLMENNVMVVNDGQSSLIIPDQIIPKEMIQIGGQWVRMHEQFSDLDHLKELHCR